MEISLGSQKVELSPHLSLTVEEAERLRLYLNEHYPDLTLDAQLAAFSHDIQRYEKNVDPYKRFEGKIELGRPVESIIRQSQEKELLEAIKAGRNVYIRGYWRMGKTTMLKSIGRHFGANAVEVNFICKTAAEAKRILAHEVAQAIYMSEHPEIRTYRENNEEGKRLMEAEDYKNIQKLEEEIHQAENVADYYNGYLAGKNLTGVIGIDEITANVDKPEVFDFVASLDRPFSNLRMAFVLHRTRRLEEPMMSRFTTGFVSNIGAVAEEDFDVLMKKYNSDGLVQFTPEAIKALKFYAGATPIALNFLLSALCSRVSNELKEFRYEKDQSLALSKLKLTFTEDDVKAVAELFCDAGADDISISRGLSLNNVLKGNNERVLDYALSGLEPEIVYALSFNPISLEEVANSFSEAKQNALASLMTFGFVIEDKENQVYRLNGEILRRIVENYTDLSISRNRCMRSEFRTRVLNVVEDD